MYIYIYIKIYTYIYNIYIYIEDTYIIKQPLAKYMVIDQNNMFFFCSFDGPGLLLLDPQDPQVWPMASIFMFFGARHILCAGENIVNQNKRRLRGCGYRGYL